MSRLSLARVRLLIWAAVPTLVANLGAQEGYGIPSAPAFTYLGVSPSRINRPSSPRNFAVAMANALDSLGRVQQGFALDVVPWILLPRRVTNEKYRTSIPDFIYANTQLSLGSVRAAGTSSATDAALGIRTNLVNRTDPLTDAALGRAIDDSVAKCARLRGPDGRPVGALIENCSHESVKAVVEHWLEEQGHWNDFAVSLAVALGGRFEESRASRFVGRGGAAWGVVAVPLGDKLGQLVAQVRGDMINGAVGTADSSAVSGGARFVFGHAKTNGFGEVVASRRTGTKARGDWTFGVEFLAAEKLWLSTGIGSAYNALIARNQLVLIANMRWHMSDRPSLGGR